MNYEELAGILEYTLLKPEATASDIELLCREALYYNFLGICVNPCHVRRASQILRGSGVKVVTVVSFPLGAATTRVKALETEEAVNSGAHEIDVVMNIGAFKAGESTFVQKDIREVVAAAGPQVRVKVILETGLLTKEEIRNACLCAMQAGAHFVKTSTGFGPTGASAEDVFLLRQTAGNAMGVKAAGGIRTLEKAEELIKAGADRLGTSSATAIIREFRKKKSKKD